ncbi:hypothetical protein [Sulfitobacter sp. R18_1]|uniref:hypothetical protein n=1 Tax=Sulfitobacter sp. R18_1 TaxID=2821104 RepID=UPI001ADB315A|nr:hypothetical protein [Sulfitobacter sp. R18_1]MBO9429594.1 hypothetical protein [Sulfitobacter sp. R18_1]
MFEKLKRTLLRIHQNGGPFHPTILVFATGQLSDVDCIPMPRDPAPEIGQQFGKALVQDLEDALKVNSSIHDGAILFQRSRQDEVYYLSAWSMRIVSQHKPVFSEPNMGSAYNSTLALSMSTTVDACCILSPEKVVFFVDGQAANLKAIPQSQA